MIEEDENERYYREQHQKHWNEMVGAILAATTIVALFALYQFIAWSVG